MRAVAEERLANTSEAFSTHIDRCLGCRACEQVCPAGVEYGQLLEASREELLSAQPKSDVTHKLLRFLLRHVWPSPGRLQMLFSAARLFRDMGMARVLLKTKLPGLLSRRAEFGLALLESSRSSVKGSERAIDNTGRESTTVLLFKGCVGEGLFARVNKATVRVLQANGFAVKTPAAQVCCGALHAHAGDLEGARKLAQRNIEAFDEDENALVITNAGGCGAMLESYAHLFEQDERLAEKAKLFSARVRDVGEPLAASSVRGGASEGKACTYDASCHLLYGEHAADASLKMLEAISGLRFSPLEGSERCCGGAGIYNLMQPEMSDQVLQDKLKHIMETKAEVLATGNPGCQMQIGAGALLSGIKLRVCHPVELLDEAYRRSGVYGENDSAS